MKKLIAVIFGLALAGAPCAAVERTPEWFGWTMAGVAIGVGAVYMANESHNWRQHAKDDGRTADRIWATQESKYGLPYQARAADLWAQDAARMRHAQHLKQIAVGLGIASVSCLGVGVTFGVDGLLVYKSVRFR